MVDPSGTSFVLSEADAYWFIAKAGGLDASDYFIKV